ncbi:MAG: hypothetical protein F6K26_47390, partial [Moorea sp. SIO2I5]|nr:hypothetical protein [Moorena sp. SIO2I5]
MDAIALFFLAFFSDQTPTFPTDFNHYKIYESVQFEIKEAVFFRSNPDQVKDFIISKQPEAQAENQ